MNHRRSWAAAWKIARRDLGSGFAGLRLLLVCLFLGVGALAAIGSLTGAVRGEIERSGREFLGGDLQVEVWQRGLQAEERAALDELGSVSAGTRMQAMASAGDLATPVELKAVDANWPLVGSFTLDNGRVAGAPTGNKAWLAKGAADRLGVTTGDTFTIGSRQLEVGGIIGNEPDRLGEGFALGPTVIVAEAFPESAGLLAPGSMYRTRVRVAFDNPADPEQVQEDLEERFPSAGFEYDDRTNAAPGANRFVSRMGEFLTLVGLAALVIAGIGIGGGVSSYLQRRRTGIATLKVLGAGSGDIARIYALQIGAAALAGSLAGLAAGVLVTPLLANALAGLLPVEGGFALDGWALVRALAFGLLIALVFAAPPIARARRFAAMSLMRGREETLRGDLRDAAWPVGIGIAGIVALTIAGAPQPMLSAGFLAGAAGALGLLALLGFAIRAGVRRLPAPRAPLLRLAMANLHRPGAQTGALVTALGFGLSAFVALAAIQTSLENNIASQVPERAPDFFVLDIPLNRADSFEQVVRARDANADIRTVPALRGRILAYGPPQDMVRVAELEELPEGAWPLRGERGLTYSTDVPEGNRLTDGEWWPADYSGQPLVSVDEELARAIGLELGDTLTIGVLGAERTARIASFRTIDWESLGFNYVLVFSPNTFADVPHNLAATLDVADDVPRGALLRDLVRDFPSSSVIEVGDLLVQARELLGQVSTAILVAASVTVLAGIAVLIGAIAAVRASRIYDTVILRVLGASRRQVLVLQLAEYALLSAILALVALLLGSAIAWGVTVQLFEFEWMPGWPRIIGVLAAGLVLIIGFALAGSLAILRARPASALRTL
jgi:putative ABC transport system permease protein